MTFNIALLADMALFLTAYSLYLHICGYDCATVFAGVTRVTWPDAADYDLPHRSPLGFSLAHQ
jgi:hypothetical protein